MTNTITTFPTHIGYKLTTQELTTHGGKQWKLGVWESATKEGNRPCSNQVLHYYPTWEIALFLNPIHADIKTPVLFEVECSEQLGTDGLKAWCKKQRLVKRLPVPRITTEQRVAFAIYCAQPAASVEWNLWATNWLNGADRTEDAAYAAADAADAAARAAADAADAAAYAAARTARTAGAARTAARTARTAAARTAAATTFLQECAIKALAFKY